VIIAGLALAVASADAPTLPVFGIFGLTCAEWNRRNSDPGYKLSQTSFVAGFLTGLNLGTRSNQTGKTDVQTFKAEIDRLCLRGPNTGKTVYEILSVATYVIQSEAHGKGVTPTWPPQR
jgi:hypothetical protein